jgi:site-specific DNA-adenine methylase
MRQKTLFGYPKIKNQIPPAIPYMGNKRTIATKILNSIYKTIGDFDNFYDLFGGGGSMSTAALIAGHSVHYNDLNKGVANLMRHLRDGGEIPYNWVSREEFHEHKDGDDWYSGIIKTCWSFGNNQKDYLFSPENEILKKEAHEYLMKNGYNRTPEKRLELIRQFKKDKNIIGRFELQQLEQLQRLEQLERLQRLERLEQLQITSKDYKSVVIKPNSVIYCDPPYQNTANYQEEINHKSL